MCYRIKVTAILCAALLSIIAFSVSYGWTGGRGELSSMPGPYLLSPTTDNIDLSARDHLEFKWERTDLVRTGHFDFRLYKGYDTTEKNLILKRQFTPDEYPIKVPASQFEAGQTYTWVLIQVFLDGQKSDSSYSPFKIIKK